MVITSFTQLNTVKAADGIIVINADGSIEPSTAPIQQNGETYTLTSNIYDSIVINRSNIIFNGADRTLDGSQSTTYAIFLTNIENVTIQNVRITNYQKGITLEYCTKVTITGCHITHNDYWGIGLYRESTYNTVKDNYVAFNNLSGIDVYNGSNYNQISENTVENNQWAGIAIYASSYNNVSENTFTENHDEGILISDSASTENIIFKNRIENNNIGIELHNTRRNLIYNNEILSNTQQTNIGYDIDTNFIYRANSWDNSYIIGGNYWSDYTGEDTNNDGIGDSPYTIDEMNIDHYPLVPITEPETPNEPTQTEPTTPTEPETPNEPTQTEPTTPTEPETQDNSIDPKNNTINFVLIGFLIAAVVLAIIIIYRLKFQNRSV